MFLVADGAGFVQGRHGCVPRTAAAGAGEGAPGVNRKIGTHPSNGDSCLERVRAPGALGAQDVYMRVKRLPTKAGAGDVYMRVKRLPKAEQEFIFKAWSVDVKSKLRKKQLIDKLSSRLYLPTSQKSAH
eukprot:81046-Pyramimonas_sp.AAC.1